MASRTPASRGQCGTPRAKRLPFLASDLCRLPRSCPISARSWK
jgi:hypothetical protein